MAIVVYFVRVQLVGIFLESSPGSTEKAAEGRAERFSGGAAIIVVPNKGNILKL